MDHRPNNPALGAYNELTRNILPFWMQRTVDTRHGGFVGRVDERGNVVPGATKGAVLNTRILWTFAAAYRVLGDPAYLAMAVRAKDYILDKFLDREYGGIYWSLDETGKPLDTKKQTYAIGFAIYGLSELYRASGDREALDVAKQLFRSLEENVWDNGHGGYTEALGRSWKPIGDVRLSDKDDNAVKTMNTHLHVIEPYTNLYRVWKDDLLRTRMSGLLKIFTERIFDPSSGHLGLFFDNDWTRTGTAFSYGHDIEGSWLLHETALELGDAESIASVEPVVRALAVAAAQGLRPDGSMVYEYDPQTGHTDTDRHWWVQAEAVVGYYNIYQHFSDTRALEIAEACMDYILAKFSGGPGMEWHWSVDGEGNPVPGGDKAGFWKCPYHNSRMCLEMIERTELKI